MADVQHDNTLRRDVVVVGAGPCGLTTARELTKQGRSVAVVEARERVGGRTWTATVDGASLELGGQWVSPDQTALMSLTDELGLELYSRYRDGDNVYVGPDGTPVRYTGDAIPASKTTVAEIERLVATLDDLAAQISADAPWAHPRAREWDTVSLRDWLRMQSDDEEARAAIRHFLAGGMLTKPAHAFSLLQALLMAASAGSFSHLVDEDFILDKRVVGGMQLVSQRLAHELDGDVVLSSPVRSLHWTDAGVRLDSDRVYVEASQAVLAMPPNLYPRISFDPPLPRRQHQMHQHQSMGLVIKVHAVYDTPFWRDTGLSGTCFSPPLTVQEIYDNTGYNDSAGTLVAFVPDEKADAMFALSPEERRRTILDCFATCLGEAAREPRVYYESDWAAEEWTRGAYATSYDLGGLHRYGPDQLTPVGPIYWASSDLAGAGYQHVDGAVRLGRATAERISNV